VPVFMMVVVIMIMIVVIVIVIMVIMIVIMMVIVVIVIVTAMVTVVTGTRLPGRRRFRPAALGLGWPARFCGQKVRMVSFVHCHRSFSGSLPAHLDMGDTT
jgi:hypothetical protein